MSTAGSGSVAMNSPPTASRFRKIGRSYGWLSR